MKIVILLMISGWMAACSGSTTPPAATEAPFYAPDFTLDSLNGLTYTLSGLRGRWVIVNFWATWCEPCKREMPDLDALAAAYADDLVVLGINVRENSDLIRTFLDDIPVTFPILIDPNDQVLIDYVVTGLPQTVLVDPQGIVIFRAFGPIDREAFIDLLRDAVTDSTS